MTAEALDFLTFSHKPLVVVKYLNNPPFFKSASELKREREILFFKFGFVFVSGDDSIHIMFPKVHRQHCSNFLSMASFFFNSICSSTCLLHVIFGRALSLLPTTSKPTFFTTHHHDPFSKYVHTIVLYWIMLVFLKYN